ncbi:predicted protein [Postia placenta Mad-698-R]|nr:predicted protein [Postia placenta Mad-698-R]
MSLMMLGIAGVSCVPRVGVFRRFGLTLRSAEACRSPFELWTADAVLIPVLQHVEKLMAERTIVDKAYIRQIVGKTAHSLTFEDACSLSQYSSPRLHAWLMHTNKCSYPASPNSLLVNSASNSGDDDVPSALLGRDTSLEGRRDRADCKIAVLQYERDGRGVGKEEDLHWAIVIQTVSRPDTKSRLPCFQVYDLNFNDEWGKHWQLYDRDVSLLGTRK